MKSKTLASPHKNIQFIDFSDFPSKDQMTLNDFFLDNEFTYQIMIGISELDNAEKLQLLYDCVDNLQPLAVKKNISTDPQFIGKDPTATLVEILKRQSQIEFVDNEQFYNSFLSIFSDFIESDFKYNRDKGMFRTCLFLKGDEPFFEVHAEKYFSDKLALLIIFLINQQLRNMRDDFTSGKYDFNSFSSDIEKHGTVFPLIAIYPSVKFDRMKSQEGAFLYQTPHYIGTSRNYMSFPKIEPDLEIIIRDKEAIYRSLNQLGINQKTVFPDHDNIAEYLKSKYLLNPEK